MKLNFDEIKEEELKNYNNGEGTFLARISNDGTNKIIKGKLKKGCSIGLHTHENTSEIIYVISGEGIMTTNGVEEILKSGDVTYCPNGSNHTFRNENDEDLIFFGVIPNHKI